MPIYFHRENERFGFFSNFSRHSIVVRGEVWPTVEHFYQAAKFPHEPAVLACIREAKRPGKALWWARTESGKIRADWASVRDLAMLEGLRAKFHQHPELRAALLATGDEELVEHTPRDSYWGDGGDGAGQNKLGRLLMQVRGELREAEGER